MMRVLEFVDTHAPYLHADATLQDAVDKLDLYKATVLPVLNEDGAVVGLITEQQVFDALFAEWRVASQQFPRRNSRRSAPTRTPVKTRPSRSG
jgi:CBS domain pair.